MENRVYACKLRLIVMSFWANVTNWKRNASIIQMPLCLCVYYGTMAINFLCLHSPTSPYCKPVSGVCAFFLSCGRRFSFCRYFDFNTFHMHTFHISAASKWPIRLSINMNENSFSHVQIFRSCLHFHNSENGIQWPKFVRYCCVPHNTQKPQFLNFAVVMRYFSFHFQFVSTTSWDPQC